MSCGYVGGSREFTRVWSVSVRPSPAPLAASRLRGFGLDCSSNIGGMSTAVSRQQILRAYRRLYQHGLRAVQYSQPARYILRDRLRRLFRDGDPADFDQSRISNTLMFLRGAALHKGLEHRIVTNLLFVWFHEPHALANRWKG